MIGCLSTQALAFLVVFVYAMQAIAFEWKPGLSRQTRSTDHSKVPSDSRLTTSNQIKSNLNEINLMTFNFLFYV